MEELKKYLKCLEYCGLDENASDEQKAECVSMIRSDYDDSTLCTVIDGAKEECFSETTPQFKQLILLFKEILKFIYVVRKYASENSSTANTFDPFLIPLVASIPLEEFNITLNDLSCIDFPGDGKSMEKYPSTLSEYITIFRQLMNQPETQTSNMDSWMSTLSEKRKNMNTFIYDFQPWGRLLMIFVITKGQDDTIPLITKIDSYGPFIQDVEKEYLSFFKQLQRSGFMKTENSIVKLPMLRIGHKKIIRFLMGKLPPAPKYINIPKPTSTNRPRWKLGGTRRRKNKKLQRTKKRK